MQQKQYSTINITEIIIIKKHKKEKNNQPGEIYKLPSIQGKKKYKDNQVTVK